MAVVGTLSKHMWSVESAGGRVRLRSASSAEVERFRSQADDPELDRLVLGGVGGVGRPEATSLVHDESDGSPMVQELFVDGDYRDVILLAVTADEWAGPRAGETSSRRSGESGAVDLFSRTSVADSD